MAAALIFPAVTLRPWERSNSLEVESQSIVASVLALTASCIVIPAPSAEPEVSPEPLFRVIFLSSTSRVAVFKVVVSPWTVKLPAIVTLPAEVIATAVVSSAELFEVLYVYSLTHSIMVNVCSSCWFKS